MTTFGPNRRNARRLALFDADDSIWRGLYKTLSEVTGERSPVMCGRWPLPGMTMSDCLEQESADVLRWTGGLDAALSLLRKHHNAFDGARELFTMLSELGVEPVIVSYVPDVFLVPMLEHHRLSASLVCNRLCRKALAKRRAVLSHPPVDKGEVAKQLARRNQVVLVAGDSHGDVRCGRGNRGMFGEATACGASALASEHGTAALDWCRSNLSATRFKQYRTFQLPVRNWVRERISQASL